MCINDISASASAGAHDVHNGSAPAVQWQSGDYDCCGSFVTCLASLLSSVSIVSVPVVGQFNHRSKNEQQQLSGAIFGSS